MIEVATDEADGEQRRLTIASTGMPNRGRPLCRRRTVVSALHLRSKWDNSRVRGTARQHPRVRVTTAYH